MDRPRRQRLAAVGPPLRLIQEHDHDHHSFRGRPRHGCGKGIGAGIAEALARTGMPVAVNYAHGKDTADAVVDRIRSAGGTAAAFQADISDE